MLRDEEELRQLQKRLINVISKLDQNPGQGSEAANVLKDWVVAIMWVLKLPEADDSHARLLNIISVIEEHY